MGRPRQEEAEKHPLHEQFNGDVPWLDGCKEYARETCLDCPVELKKCPAENPRFIRMVVPKASKRIKEEYESSKI